MPRVVIAESVRLVADLLESNLVASGYEVRGVARTMDEAIELIDLQKPDLAIIDIKLVRGGRAPDFVHRLTRQGDLGVLYVTEDNAWIGSLTTSDGTAVIARSYRTSEIVRALEIVSQIVKGTRPVSPFPRGFHLLPHPPVPFARVSAR